MSGSFSKIAFLAFIEAEVTSDSKPLLAGISRIAPLLIPLSLLNSTLALLPSSAEYYVLTDSTTSHSQISDLLDNGAAKVVSPDTTLIGTISPSRLILRIGSTTATLLADTNILNGISSILLDTPSFTENLLKSYRTALNNATGRPRDLFILASSREPEVILHQPASLKLMSKTVNGTSVLPFSFLSLSLGNPTSPQPEDGKLSITTLFTSTLRSDRSDGLFPTLPISLSSVPSALGLVYSSSASIANTITSGNAVYYSRSRNGLWRKGETSGAMQMVERIRIDCDSDALEFGVLETGPNGEKDGFCHVPDQQSCFGPNSGLAELEATLKGRKKDAPKGSYSARLFAEPALLKAKIMEEASELCEATTKEEIAAEAADLFYFALAKCVGAGVGLREISKVLDKRAMKVTRRKGDAKKEWVEKLGLTNGQSLGVAGGVSGSSPSPAPQS
ncbi:hypothetical protein P7C70_g9169, partial [Phenoliferia sp. Uapishka_3]